MRCHSEQMYRNALLCMEILMKKAIAILYHGRKQDTSELARRLAPQLQAQGHDVRVIDMREEHE